MPRFHGFVLRYLAILSFAIIALGAPFLANAQTGNSGSIQGTVTDPSGAVVPNASVTLKNSVSGFSRTTQSNGTGQFALLNVPFNTYQIAISASGFASANQSVDVRSVIPVTISIPLAVTGNVDTVTVSASADLVENDPVGHTDVDRGLFEKIPLESSTSSLTSLVTMAAPGISADSNGMAHGMGDHASNSYSVDDQPITDQQSKQFSNQIPLDSVQSLEVIPGAPPAEYGGKTSLVVVATTRSGLNETKPHGQVTTSYGSFGSSDLGFNFAYGSAKWGNFISGSGANSGRFLDGPEFSVFHDKGNEENFFDRVDFQPNAPNSFRLNLGFTRSWFQTPNSFDSQDATAWAGTGYDPGPADQRSQIQTFNIAPTYTRIVDPSTVFNFGVFIRRDAFNYYPSGNPLADRGPVNLQQETISQYRTLQNTGVRADVTHTRGINNFKIGLTYQQTFLDENFHLGIVDPDLIPNLGCGTAEDPEPGTPCATLAPYDLTAGGGLYTFDGHTDIKEGAAYIQDAITVGNWSMNLGLRGDIYNGLTVARQLEPRVGLSYKIKKTGTDLRLSYARTLESPFNENLILASEGCNSAVIAALIPCVTAPNSPGQRNDFHAGLQQSLGKFAVFSGDYVWKYTHNAYDFSVLGATPITFPIGWHNSKIPGFDGRLSMPERHGVSAQMVFSSVAARFFTPQTSGLGTIPTPPGQAAASVPFRIDHDEKFNQTTHVQYQYNKRVPWMGFNWRFDSGQVAGAAPCYGVGADNDCPQSTLLNGQPAVKMQDPFGNPLTADQEFQAGFTCAGQRATPTNPLPTVCLASQFGSNLISVPSPGTQNDDHNPARIASRNLFDLAFGQDNLFHGDKKTVSAHVTIVNLTDKYALYNFLSTFSGTHYVSPRSITAEIGFHF
jgi:Carboxypeptidase regulatory-like domain